MNYSMHLEVPSKYFLVKLILLMLIFPKLTYGQSQPNAIYSGERHHFFSNTLKEERSYQVFLPLSYHSTTKNNYPVVYIMDGDYNFHFATGLIEFLSSTSGSIPEMIVVGISDQGMEKYRDYCRPSNTGAEGGHADEFMLFLEKELIPLIKKNYRASQYETLVGHSMGGLFVTNAFLTRPEIFDCHIAIDASLWWNNFEIISRADSIYESKKELSSMLYMSQARSQSMGVDSLSFVLDKYFPEKEHWNFSHYETENHGSVAMVAIKDAFEDLFEGWEISRETFYTFKNASDFSKHYQVFNERFESSFMLHPTITKNVIYFYDAKNRVGAMDSLEQELITNFPGSLEDFYVTKGSLAKEKENYTEAISILESNLKRNPNSYQSCDELSKMYLKMGEQEKAKIFSRQTLEIANRIGLRQWQLNELAAQERSVNK